MSNEARKAGFNSSMVEIFDLFGMARKGLAEPSTEDWTLRTAKGNQRGYRKAQI